MEPVAELVSLRFLLGTWRGRGRGDYPTIEPFTYEEEISFTHAGKPFIVYAQKTWTPDGRPLHTETGYLRPVGIDGAELVVAQPTGITEIHSGVVDGASVRFSTRGVGVSPTAKDVRSVARSLWVEDDTLRYRLDMAAVGLRLQFHLEAALARTE
jgi:hypothetical protein